MDGDRSGSWREFGPYRLERKLGEGGGGEVFIALDPRLERRVALKRLRPGAKEVERRRFMAEGRAVARLHHPGVVAVHEVGEVEGQPYLVMDLVEGQSLAERIQRHGPPRPDTAAKAALEVARALSYAHGEGILHRDVKPHNVLLDSEGQAFLADFGLARDARDEGTRLTAAGEVLGSPSYMSPEQAEGGARGVDARSDVYGLGATLYQALTGAPPFAEGSVAQTLVALLTTAPEAPSARRPGLHPDLEAICLRCLEKDPADRYPSAAGVARDLERYLTRSAVADAQVVMAPVGGEAGVAALVFVAGGAALVLLGILGLLVALGRTPAAAPTSAAAPPRSEGGSGDEPAAQADAVVEVGDPGAVIDSALAVREPTPAAGGAEVDLPGTAPPDPPPPPSLSPLEVGRPRQREIELPGSVGGLSRDSMHLDWVAAEGALYLFQSGSVVKVDAEALEVVVWRRLMGGTDSGLWAGGVVVAQGGDQGGLVVWDHDLTDLRKIPLPGVWDLLSARGTNLALALYQHGRTRGEALVDLERGEIVRDTHWLSTDHSAPGLVEPDPAGVTGVERGVPQGLLSYGVLLPGGRHVITRPGQGIARYRLERERILWEESSWPLGPAWAPSVSLDGDYVARPPLAGEGNRAPPQAPHHPRPGQGVYVYRTGDLGRPVGWAPMPSMNRLGFVTEPELRLVTHDRDTSQLVVFDAEGRELASYGLDPQRFGGVLEVFPLPGGRRVFLATVRELWCLEFHPDSPWLAR
jgi:Protein kinase domain